jgi:hypothetical protein
MGCVLMTKIKKALNEIKPSEIITIFKNKYYDIYNELI